MNQVSIIINGVRYDAVPNPTHPICDNCDLLDECEKIDNLVEVDTVKFCHYLVGGRHFKKSNKKFES